MEAAHVMTPIAVIGAGALLPGSANAPGFWRNVVAGRDQVREVPETHWLIADYFDPDPKRQDRTYCKTGAFMDEVLFEPLAYGIPPNELEATDTSQLLGLLAAREALDDAFGGHFAEADKDRISVFIGACGSPELLRHMSHRLERPIWSKAMREIGLTKDQADAACDRIIEHYVPWQKMTFPGLLGNVIPGRIANRFDLGGTNFAVDAACASSLAAVAMAIHELESGQASVAVAGGVDTMNDPAMFICFSKTPALSPTFDCRPFSDHADGTVLGEGICLLALKRLDEAERDGDAIYAVIRGIGSASDGRAKTLFAPLAEGQAKAMRRAYAVAGYGPESVELVEAHGTGTRVGDAVEFDGLRSVFDETGRPDRQWCGLGSVKSQIGHTKGAAGAVGLMKLVYALNHKVLPPTIKVDHPSPDLHLPETPFYLNTQTRPWTRGSGHPRRGGLSASGFGGTNFHLTVEEYVGGGRRAAKVRPEGSALVMVCAADSRGAAEACRAMAHDAAEPGMLEWLAYSTQQAFDVAARCRVAVVASDGEELAARLMRAEERLDAAPNTNISEAGIVAGYGAREGAVAFLFPGQGSQYLGMGGPLAMFDEAAQAVWDRSADLALDPALSLHEVVFPRPVFSDQERDAAAATLTRTEWAQPALGAMSLAMLAVLRRVGVVPEMVAGHSFGEVCALHAAGVISADDLLHIARRRGELMAEASSVPGAMIAVAATRAEVEAEIAAAGVSVVIANHNAPRQVVVAGPVEAIAAFEHHLDASRISGHAIGARRLPVATAFHTALVAPAAAPFGAFLATLDLQAPRLPVFAGATASIYPAGPSDAVRAIVAEQLARPVEFVSTIEAMYAAGARYFVEVGAGSVLGGLATACLAGRPHLAVSLDRRGVSGLDAFWSGLATLAASGCALDLAALWDGYARPADPRQRTKPEFAVAINGMNYGRAYPERPGGPKLPPPHKVPTVTSASHEIAAQVATPEPLVSGVPDVAMAMAVTSVTPQTMVRAPRATHEAEASIPVEHAPVTRPHVGPLHAGDGAPADAFRIYQQALSEAHSSFQSSMASSHAAIISAMESGFRAAFGASTVPADPSPQLALPSTGIAGAAPVPTPVSAYAAPVVALSRKQETSIAPPSAPPKRFDAALPAADPPARSATPPATGVAAARPTQDVLAMLLAVVSEKTGFPAEMLNPEMKLEADLGVDSITQVEILATLQEQMGGTFESDTGLLVQSRTLRQIADYFASQAAQDEDAQSAAAAQSVASGIAGPGELQVSEGLPSLRPSPTIVVPMSVPVDSGAPSQSLQDSDVRRAFASRQVLRAVPAAGSGQPTLPPPAAGTVALVGGPAAVAEALAGRLRNHGYAVRVFADLPSEPCAAAVFLGGLAEVADAGEALGIQRQAFRLACWTAVHPGGAFITVQDTGGRFGTTSLLPNRCWLGGIAGVTKSAAREWPQVAARAIDLDQAGRDADSLATVLEEELLHGGRDELEVGLPTDGTRVTLRTIGAESAGAGLSLDPSAVVVASGGGRGVTAAVVIGMAARYRCRFVLLGRSMLIDEPAELRDAADDAALKRALLRLAAQQGETLSPMGLSRRSAEILAAREIRGTLAAIAASGGTARYVSADVRDGAALGSALAAVRRDWGPVDVLLHGAGVLADALLAAQTDARFDQVFGTKVKGLRSLLECMVGDELKAIVLFSSVAARFGNAGQSIYAMANETLNKVAQAEALRRGPACMVKALNWGPWDGGMVTPELAARFNRQGVLLLSRDAGVSLFLAELDHGFDGENEVVLGSELPAQPPAIFPKPAAELMPVGTMDAGQHEEQRDPADRGTAGFSPAPHGAVGVA